MTNYVALVRAVNVGGTGMLPMKELAALCSRLGFAEVRTYIQSGNVIFQSTLSEEKVQKSLEEALALRMGKRVDVFVRSGAELADILNKNPFAEIAPAKVAVLFLTKPPKSDELEKLSSPTGEEIRTGARELYIHYPNGMGRSKLRLPSTLGAATARNLNTVAKLASLARNQSVE